MKDSFQNVFKSMFSHGMATGELLAYSMRDSLVYGIEQVNREDEKLYNASFGDLRDIANPTGEGFCVNGTDYMNDMETSFKNFLIVGSTGSRKSTIVAITNLLSVDGPSVICHDASGELMDYTAQHFIDKKYSVYVFDPNDTERSIGINLFDFIKTPSDANKISALLIRHSMGNNASDKFWELSATSLLRMLILLLLKREKEYQNMGNVRQLLHAMAGAPESIDRLMAKYAPDDLFLEYKALIKGNEKTLSSIIMSAQTALELWNDDGVCKLTSNTTISFEAFKREKSVLFLKNSTFDAVYYSALLGCILENIIKIYMSRLPVKGKKENPIWFCLDECATLSPALVSLSQILSNNRKFSLGFMLFFQNIAQIYNSFGQESGTNILANCHSKLFLPGSDMRTANDLEEFLGKKTIVDETGKERVIPLMLAQNIRMMKSDEALLLCGAHKPFKVTTKPFFEQPFMRRKAGKDSFEYTPPTILQPVKLISLV